MLIPTVVVIAIVAILWIGILGLTVRVWWFLRRARRQPPGDASYTPPAALIVPCCGVEQGFADNMRAMLGQDYPDYRVIFVTADAADPAYPVLQRLIAGPGPGRAVLVTAGHARTRGQKVHNLLRGVAEAGDRPILAFADSDGRPHSRWLRDLVAPLADPGVGGTTGYPRYQPARGGLWSWTRAYAVNLSALQVSQGGDWGLWGGGMAVRRETFDRAGVAAAWETAIADDIAIVQQIRRLGLRLVFVPACLTTSVEGCTLAGLFEYLFRHLVIARVHNRPYWRLLGAALGALILLYVGGGTLGLLASLRPELWPAAGLLLLHIPLQVVAGALIPLLVFRDTETARWAPTLFLLEAVTLAAFVASALTRRVSWRGVHYELVAPDRTVVVASDQVRQGGAELAGRGVVGRPAPHVAGAQQQPGARLRPDARQGAVRLRGH